MNPRFLTCGVLFSTWLTVVACGSSGSGNGSDGGSGAQAGTSAAGGTTGSGGSDATSGGSGNAAGANTSGHGGESAASASGGSDAAGAGGGTAAGRGGGNASGRGGTEASGGSGGSGEAGGAGATGGGAGASGGLPDLDPNADVATLTPEQQGELCDWWVGLFGGYNVMTPCEGGSSLTAPNQALCLNMLKFHCPVKVSQFEACELSTVPSGGCDTSDLSCHALFCIQ